MAPQPQTDLSGLDPRMVAALEALDPKDLPRLIAGVLSAAEASGAGSPRAGDVLRRRRGDAATS